MIYSSKVREKEKYRVCKSWTLHHLIYDTHPLHYQGLTADTAYSWRALRGTFRRDDTKISSYRANVSRVGGK